MRCPVCNIPMIVVEHQAIEIDFCTGCRGVWFDSGELEMLLHKLDLEAAGLSAGDILDSPEAESVENRRRCPVCRRKMRKSTLVKEPDVLVDVCPRGEGIWFDGGEMGQLADRLSATEPAEADSRERVLRFFAGVFPARD